MTSTERDTLLALYRSAAGETWYRNDNWDTDADLSEWFGVEVNDQGYVVELSLFENNLQGPIPAALGALHQLKKRQLYNCKLIGVIPKELGALTELEVLSIHTNKLTGVIPEEIGALRKLKELLLSRNKLHGKIPSSLGQLVSLEWLSLRDNEINGDVPAFLGQLGNLIRLSLRDNKLGGHIPKQLGALKKLETLYLNGNQLLGHIPEELGALIKLKVLGLSNNQLTGAVPKELGNLTALTYLGLNNNNLEGESRITRQFRNSVLIASIRPVCFTRPSAALWDHTQDIQDIAHEEEAASTSAGGLVPRQLRRLLDVLAQADRKGVLDLKENPWVEPPESVVFRDYRVDVKAVKGYFEDLYAEPSRVHRNSVKIVLVGQEGAGKTSLRQSMKAKKASPTGEWREESTVFADVELMEIEGASVRVYDCAGQVAYTGLLQMFLTPRSVCLLVCDAQAFGQPGSGGQGEIKEDCRKLEELRVCDWLRSISRRVPHNDVILVATKCDLAGGKSREIGRRIEVACRRWLTSWVRDGMQPVRLEEGVCLTSCCATAVDAKIEAGTGNDASKGNWACDWTDERDEDPSRSLLHRLVYKRDGGGLRGAQMVLPRSWDIALIVLGALERGRDPVDAVVQKVVNPDGGEMETADNKTGVFQGITVEDLSAIWLKTVLELERKGIKVTNAENALEGALLIREFEGCLVRYDKFVFLDVVWLARILKPLLNHKDEETFDGLTKLGDTGDLRVTLEDPMDIASWGRLKSEGILEPRLAQAIWPAGLSEYVLPTLRFLSLTFPLENDPAGGLVVLLRLMPERPERVGKVIDAFCSENTPAFSASWKVFLGVPAGAIEKVLTRCCSLGSVRTFWRCGVLVHGNLGGRDGSGLFALAIEYASSDNELIAQVYGDRRHPAPWAALSYAVSAVRYMLLEYSGLRSKGSLMCPQHGDAMLFSTKVSPSMLLNNSRNVICVDQASRAGDPLLLGRPGCPQCSPETMGQGAAAIELLCMVDTRLDRSDIFDDVKERFDGLEKRYAFTHQAIISKDEAVLVRKMDDLTVAVKGGLGDMQGEMKGRLEEVKAGLGEMKGGLSRIEGEVAEGFQSVESGLGEVKGALDKVAASVQESLLRIKSLQAPNFPYPYLVAVKQVDSSDASSRSTRKRTLLNSLRGMGTKDMTLRFLCPVDLSEVPCGFGGEGFQFRKARDWVHKLSPALQVAVVTAKVALKATTGLDMPASGFLNAVAAGLYDGLVDRTLDEDALLRVILGEEGPSAEMERDGRASYDALKKFIEKMESKRRKNAGEDDGYVDFRDRMQRVGDGREGMVWVRNENVRRWLDSLAKPAPPS
ncbi:unnamed protein product [Scytosiphon promiscuus]